jgi:hypothetical protein
MNRTNTTINSNYNYGNKSNITTLTNMTSKYEYKPYTLIDNEKDFVILVLEMSLKRF